MIRTAVVAASIGLLLSSQAALAAESVRLDGVQGAVLVNRDGRYVPVTASTQLRAGDRIMSMDGSAKVSYGAGCSVTVAAHSMATVSAASPCAGGSSNVVRAAYKDDEEGYGAPTEPPGQGWDFWTWAAFGGITIGVTAAVISNDSEPTSP